jgi:chromosome segregation protein
MATIAGLRRGSRAPRSSSPALTGNSFAGLTPDYREDDVLTLVAGRADGSLVPIAGLSEGTRDQLYLALPSSRLASSPLAPIG